MADANIPPRPQPDDWSTAFAALPLEPAPRDAWARLARALPPERGAARATPGMPARRPVRRRIALAAVASVALALPVTWWLGTSTQAPLPTAAAVDVTSSRSTPPTRHRDATPAAPADHAAKPPVAIAARGPTDTPARRATLAPAVRAVTPPRTRGPANAALAAGASSVDTSATSVTPAALPTDARGGGAIAPRVDTGEAGITASSRLADLRRESARLEALVAQARDERMASAPVAVMSASLDDRIRLIDAALMQSGIDEMQRASLWSERVGALQELASLEGTQRWMAAHGASMDAVARVD